MLMVNRLLTELLFLRTGADITPSSQDLDIVLVSNVASSMNATADFCRHL